MSTKWDIPDHMREDILRMHRRGVPVSEIVDILGVNTSTVMVVLQPTFKRPVSVALMG